MSNPSNLSNVLLPQIPVSQSIYEESTSQQARIGSRVVVGDTEYRYAKAGTNMVAGNICVSINDTAVNKSTVGAAVAVGTFEVPIYSATDLAAQAFADSYLCVMDSGGEGISYRIKNHPAITATTAGQKVTLYDAIASGGAMTTATKLAIVQNPYAKLLSGTDVTVTAPVWGVAPIAVTSGNYFWAAVAGPASVKLGNGTATVGTKLAAGTTGYALSIDATANATAYIGVCLTLTGTAYDSVITMLNCNGGC
jgi:hypothetical protein